MRHHSFASSAGRRSAPAALIFLLALLAGTWAVGQAASTGRAPAEPPGQSLAGSFVVFDSSMGGATSYQTGIPADFCFRAESFSNDWEWATAFWLRFPAGWVVNSVTVVGTPSCVNGGTWGSFSWSFETPGNEIRINHARNHVSSGDHCTAYYMVNGRRYTPTTNRPSLARILSSHLPLEGKLIGVDGTKRGRLDRTLTKRTMSGRMGWSAK